MNKFFSILLTFASLVFLGNSSQARIDIKAHKECGQFNNDTQLICPGEHQRMVGTKDKSTNRLYNHYLMLSAQITTESREISSLASAGKINEACQKQAGVIRKLGEAARSQAGACERIANLCITKCKGNFRLSDKLQECKKIKKEQVQKTLKDAQNLQGQLQGLVNCSSDTSR